jgi:hypothetical protein
MNDIDQQMTESKSRFIEFDGDDEPVMISRSPARETGAEQAESSAVQVTDFGDALQLEELANGIRLCHEAILATFQSSIQHAKEAGELLIRVKDSLPHGEFGRWVVEHCHFSPETARGYMRVARRWHELKSADPERQRVTEVSYRAALAQLAKPRSDGSDSKDRSAKADEREHESARSGPAADASGPNNSSRCRVSACGFTRAFHESDRSTRSDSWPTWD